MEITLAEVTYIYDVEHNNKHYTLTRKSNNYDTDYFIWSTSEDKSIDEDNALYDEIVNAYEEAMNDGFIFDNILTK